jgi:hypothetical protein
MDPSRRRLLGALVGAAASGAVVETLAATAPAIADHPMVARIWHGRTSADKRAGRANLDRSISGFSA